MCSLAGLFWRNDRGEAEVIPSEPIPSLFIIWHNAHSPADKCSGCSHARAPENEKMPVDSYNAALRGQVCSDGMAEAQPRSFRQNRPASEYIIWHNAHSPANRCSSCSHTCTWKRKKMSVDNYNAALRGQVQVLVTLTRWVPSQVFSFGTPVANVWQWSVFLDLG